MMTRISNRNAFLAIVFTILQQQQQHSNVLASSAGSSIPPPPTSPSAVSTTGASQNITSSPTITTTTTTVTSKVPYNPQHRSNGIVPGRKHQHGDSIAAFLNDLNALKSLEEQQPDLTILKRTHAMYDSSFSKIWTHADWEKHQRKAFVRYQRHMISWIRSPTAKKVLPTVLSVVGWSLLVHCVASRLPWLFEGTRKASFSSAVGAFSAPISLLLALRTNRALNRLLEARRQFGIMIRACGSLATLSALYIAPLSQEKAILAARYLSIHGWAMKGLVRQEDDSTVIQSVLPSEEAAWVAASPLDSPTTFLLRLRQIIASVVDDLPWTAAKAMEDRIVELETVMGICKRLIGSPIPPTYTRHTSRVLCLYLGVLPFALVGSKVSLVGLLLNVAFLSYIFVGIDEISVEIEHPFPIMPMYDLSGAVQKNVANQFRALDLGAPSLPL